MKKILLVLVAFALVCSFGGGVYVGNTFHTNASGIDPQDYIKTVFTPYDDGTASYLSFLDKAQGSDSIYIADYTFNEPQVVDKLLELNKSRKVDIHLILDLSQTTGSSGTSEVPQIKRLKDAGIEVVVGTSEKSHAIMHMKFTVIIGHSHLTESGCWNYTTSASKQDNFQDYIDSPSRAKLFLADWQRMHDFIVTNQAKYQDLSAAIDTSDSDAAAPAAKPAHHKK